MISSSRKVFLAEGRQEDISDCLNILICLIEYSSSLMILCPGRLKVRVSIH